MKTILQKAYKIFKYLRTKKDKTWGTFICRFLFFVNNVKYKTVISYGKPYIHVSMGATFKAGANLKLNNGVRYSDSGMNGKCKIEVREKATLDIGNNVGMSDVTISCYEYIKISDNVLLGVGVQLRDTDNHSLNPIDRKDTKKDFENRKTAPIIINENVFIGGNSTILKGITIGNNAIVGASSLVSKNIPPGEIWAGNPARFIKKID